jgi:hypothetical protein
MTITYRLSHSKPREEWLRLGCLVSVRCRGLIADVALGRCDQAELSGVLPACCSRQRASIAGISR